MKLFQIYSRMKFIIICLGTLLIPFFLNAQGPQSFTYQGIATDNANNPIASKTIALRFSILPNLSGTALYAETQSVSTGVDGYFTASIGKGTAQTGTFSAINWAGNITYLKVELDPNNGTNYTIIGTTQILSVPYSLYANSANAVQVQNVSISTTSPTNGQVLKYNSTTLSWAPSADNNTSYTAGTGITLNGNTISGSYVAGNRMAITGNTISGTSYVAGTGISISGSTISNTIAGVPAGTIVAYGGTSVPGGWLLCDGTEYPRAGTYANLFAVIGTAWGSSTSSTFRVPNTQGVFLRGITNNSTGDPDANSRTALYTGGNTGNNVGSYQSDAFQGHKHNDNGHSHADAGHIHQEQRVLAGGGGGSSIAQDNGSINSQPAAQYTLTGYANIQTNYANITDAVASDYGTPSFSTETRPRNMYVNYIIKY